MRDGALVSLDVDSRVRDAVIEAQNMALQLQNQMLDIAARFEEQMTEINELREKLKRYESGEADAFSERKTKWFSLRRSPSLPAV